MKATTLRTFQTVHTWTGLIAGFALFVAFYAGALTVFHDAIASWQNPPWRSARDANVPICALIERLIEQHPEAKTDFGIVLPSDASHAAYAYWEDARGTRFARYSELASPRSEANRGDLADFIYELHDSLGVPVVGLYIMGIVSVLYGLALISGLLMHLPHLISDLFALRVGPNLKRLWQDAHNAIGVVSLPFHVIFAVTGALLCLFTLTLTALNTIAFDGKLFDDFAKAISTAPTIAAVHVPAPMLSNEALVIRAKQAALSGDVSSFEPDYLHYINYGDQSAIIEVRGLSQHTLGTYGTVAISAVTGEVLAVHVGTKHSINSMSNAVLYGLHFGSFGGNTIRWLYFLLGLAGAFLFYSGNLLWIESRRKRRHVDQPLRTQFMARVTVGVCIGTCLGISGAFAATLIATRLNVDATVPQQLACYGLFFTALAYAFVRTIPRATFELLCATSMLTVTVACVDLVSNAVALVHATSERNAVLGVDLTGLALGFVFAAFARATWRRAKFGPAHSVWALGAP